MIFPRKSGDNQIVVIMIVSALRNRDIQGRIKRFDRDFKMSAVKMRTEGGHTGAELVISLAIYSNQLYNWKRKYSKNGEKAFLGKGHLMELSALSSKLSEGERECDIFLKTTTHTFKKNRKRFWVIDDYRSEFPLEKMSYVLEVLRSGCYA